MVHGPIQGCLEQVSYNILVQKFMHYTRSILMKASRTVQNHIAAWRIRVSLVYALPYKCMLMNSCVIRKDGKKLEKN